jgi:hypothetical protein
MPAHHSLLVGRYQRFGETYCLHLQDSKDEHRNLCAVLSFHSRLSSGRLPRGFTTNVACILCVPHRSHMPAHHSLLDFTKLAIICALYSEKFRRYKAYVQHLSHRLLHLSYVQYVLSADTIDVCPSKQETMFETHTNELSKL